MQEKTRLSFTQISRALKATKLPNVDYVVGIATGGMVPASLCAYKLEVPLAMLRINYRAEDNEPQHDQPVLYSLPELPEEHLRILLVDDVSVTGSTLDVATQQLAGHATTTLVMKGRGDIVLFPNIQECVHWPWNS